MTTYAIILIIILGLVASIIKWWNLPKTIEERRLAQESRAKAQDERRSDRAAQASARQAAREKRREERARRKKP